jgi:hypothetical protein
VNSSIFQKLRENYGKKAEEGLAETKHQQNKKLSRFIWGKNG